MKLLFLLAISVAFFNVYPCENVVAPPAPQPDNSTVIKGNLTDGGNYTCLRFEFTVRLSVHYNTTENKTEVATFLLPVNSKLDAKSDACQNSTYEHFSLVSTNFSTFELAFRSTENSVFLDSLMLSVNHTEAVFPNSTQQLKFVNYTLSKLNPDFNVDKSHSYVCSNNVTVPKNDDKSVVHVIFSNLRVQAFMDKTRNGSFSEEHNCQNEINDVVPIAVGAALTGLVIIVLVAYFIGRRRSHRAAYQSV